ncbi:MAG: bacillithiol biosynthesis deacetylase BshB1 [Gemmatimonadetes bacterium]|nr:bacillithiol biosynthesis deacetylase BshB1 [Gemmatimonadota bacterium]
MTEPLDLLAIMAHPDDAELLCGGALAKAAALGDRVGILDLTRGEVGSSGSGEIRAEEAVRSAKLLGLAVRRNAGLHDSGLINDDASRSIVVGLIRELRPSVIVTHWREGRHPDHRVAAQLAYDASFLSALKNYDAPGDAHRPDKVVHCLLFREDVPRPSFVVDITDHIETKMAAVACFESQFSGKASAGEVFGAGDRPLEDQIRAQCAHHGSRIRCAYGEPFWTRETVALESLVSSRVSTF